MNGKENGIEISTAFYRTCELVSITSNKIFLIISTISSHRVFHIYMLKKKGNNNNNNNNNNEILVSIKDAGTGIHPEILPKLFTNFATKSMTGGTDLGLFISKNIIEMHGGKIWATNNNEDDGEKGIGSTFTFSLPIKQ